MWFLVMAHLVGDYGLQSDLMAQRKRASIWVLTLHVLIYAGVLALTLGLYGSITGSYSFWRFSIVAVLAGLFVTHWSQDFLKSRFFNSRQAYYLDQILHLAALFAIRLLII
jgi:hypothetical protein